MTPKEKNRSGDWNGKITPTEVLAGLEMGLGGALVSIPMVVAIIKPHRVGAVIHGDIEDEGTLVVGDQVSGAGGLVS